jgi:hypothetical protein
MKRIVRKAFTAAALVFGLGVALSSPVPAAADLFPCSCVLCQSFPNFICRGGVSFPTCAAYAAAHCPG